MQRSNSLQLFFDQKRLWTIDEKGNTMSNMVVRTNVFALNAHRNLTNVGLQQRQAAQRLSSGYRINSAADDAAGLAISESMRAQIRGLDQASINAQDGVGLIQTAEGAMQTVSEMVIRIRELMVQAANDTYTVGNRNMIQLEIDQLMTEINDVTFRTEFNTRTLLDGGLSGGGGPTSPVSLQWMVFQQARVIGLPHSGGEVGTGLHANPNNRNETSLRHQIISLQEELNSLARRVADRHVSEGTMLESALTAMFSNPGTMSFTALDTLGLLDSELQQKRNIINRLDNLVRQAEIAAGQVLSITQDQILALGGTAAINNDGSSVFDTALATAWTAAGTGGNGLYTAIQGNVSVILAAIPTTTSLATAQTLFDSVVGRPLGASLPAGATATPPTYPTNVFLHNIESLLTRSMNVLADVNLEQNAMWFQIGPNAMQGMILQLKGMHTGILGGGRGDLAMLIDVRNPAGEEISKQLEIIDLAEGIVNAQRAQLGAVQNRLEFTRQSLDISNENLSAAESRIRDTDMAKEMMRFTAAQVLQQAGISMLAQANQLPASILQLLQ
jgi:flagellin